MSRLRSVKAALVLIAGFAAPALAGPAVTPLVSSDWLAENLAADELVILDTRSAFAFERSHVPGAVQTDYPGQWAVTDGEIPWVLPSIADLEAYVTSLGITPSTTVVLISAGNGISDLGGATWIYWVLSYLGLEEVAILEGGWATWLTEDREMEEGATASIEVAPFAATLRPEIYADTGDVVAALGTDIVLVDARPPAHYVGDTIQTGVVVRPGHIPGALSLDNNLFYDRTTARFHLPEMLSAQLPPELADSAARLITYCNIGQAASISWFVLHELLGFENARMYEASLAAWTRDPELPLVTGPDP
jgi:thiosulfate/3-mercaptopyruvate sulfurtransferase